MLLSFFFDFLTNESLTLSALKQKILDEVNQSNSINPQQTNLLMIFVSS